MILQMQSADVQRRISYKLVIGVQNVKRRMDIVAPYNGNLLFFNVITFATKVTLLLKVSLYCKMEWRFFVMPGLVCVFRIRASKNYR